MVKLSKPFLILYGIVIVILIALFVTFGILLYNNSLEETVYKTEFTGSINLTIPQEAFDKISGSYMRVGVQQYPIPAQRMHNITIYTDKIYTFEGYTSPGTRRPNQASGRGFNEDHSVGYIDVPKSQTFAISADINETLQVLVITLDYSKEVALNLSIPCTHDACKFG